MRPKPKLEILPSAPREHDAAALDAFREERVHRDLASFAGEPGVFAQLLERTRIRFQKGSERAVLRHWTSFYEAGERVMAAKVALERRRSEYLQLAIEHVLKQTEKNAGLAKLRADIEEHDLRHDKAAHQRKNLQSGTTANISEDDQGQTEAQERRQLDARWEVHESLRALQNLIELQHWRRRQRDRILRDRSLTPEEQIEDLQFVDDLYQQKRTELAVDTRIFEER